VAFSRAARSAHREALDAESWMTPPPARVGELHQLRILLGGLGEELLLRAAIEFAGLTGCVSLLVGAHRPSVWRGAA
jgi:hypothetical protein